MLEKIFSGLFDNDYTAVISPLDFLLCLGGSLLLGIIMALAYTYKTRYTKSFIITLATLPAVVCVVIMMVNGNIGAGVAVAGAFSLVRFRSVPGGAKEIGTLFLAMGTGLIAGMGYLAYATLFTLIMSGVYMLSSHFDLGARKNRSLYKTLTVTIPEDLSYTGLFDEILQKYTSESELVRVKTTNMGTMYKLTYNIVLLDKAEEKELIDTLRERNGNLEIAISAQDNTVSEL